MNILLDNLTSEILEKKSRFIANVFPVKNLDEINEILKSIKKKYFDAKHNVFAYSIVSTVKDDKGDISLINSKKSSDDGEPSGTAGKPILDLIEGFDLTNTIVVVSRYFGGVLLGTGGLVRAYSDVTKNALNMQKSSKLCKGSNIIFNVSYDEYNKINNEISKLNENLADLDVSNIFEIEKNFNEEITLNLIIKDLYVEKFKNIINEITKGKFINSFSEEKKYYYKNNKSILYI